MGDSFGTIHEMVTCPYNKSHQVGASKFASHLLKCRKQYSASASDQMLICEYNQLHHVPAGEMDEHLKICQEHLNHQHHLLTQKAGQTHGTNISQSPDQKQQQLEHPYVRDEW